MWFRQPLNGTAEVSRVKWSLDRLELTGFIGAHETVAKFAESVICSLATDSVSDRREDSVISNSFFMAVVGLPA
jgi:hypothetical protein